jgi:hypothetical protein
MSEKDCITDVENVGSYAKDLISGVVAQQTHGMSGVVGGVTLGNLVSYGIDHLGQEVCNAIYDHPHSLANVSYDANSHVVTYAFTSDNSSEVIFEYVDMTCQPLDEGLCVLPDNPTSPFDASFNTSDMGGD